MACESTRVHIAHNYAAMISLVKGAAHGCGLDKVSRGPLWTEHGRSVHGDKSTEEADRYRNVLHVALTRNDDDIMMASCGPFV